MMVRHLSTDMRGLAIRYREDGRTQKDIGHLIGVSQSAVSKILTRHSTTGNIAAGVPPGRARITTARDDRVLLRMVQQNRRTPVSALTNTWSHHLDRPVSARTVNRRLTSAGYFARRLSRQPLLSQRHCINRYQWAQQHQRVTLQQWQHVVFTDESRVCLDHLDGRLRVRRMAGQPLQDQDIQPMRQGNGGSIHVWGAIHHGGKSALTILEGNVTGVSYRQLLTDVALPYVRGVFGENFVWQQDNAPAHRSRVVAEYLDQEDVTVLPWPACSPDCNPIENCWDRLKRDVHAMQPHPQNLRELGVALRTTWDNIDVEYINTLVDSMERRVASVVQCNGRHIQY